MRKVLRVLLYVLGAIIVVLLIMRLTFIETWTIPDDNDWLGVSIVPTLFTGDEVVLLTVGTPRFGELVRCEDPDKEGEWIIGRVVGLGGDMVELEGPTLRVNGVRYNTVEACKDSPFIVEHPDTNREVEVQCSRVDIGGGWHFRGTTGKYSRRRDKRKLVGDDHVFLLSDNRDLHFDSRDYDTVPLDSCDAQIVFRLWSEDGWSDSDYRMTVIR